MTKRKTVLITGGARRIGKQIAMSFFQSGWNVAIHYNASVQEAHLLEDILRAQKQPGQEVGLFQADLSQEKDYLDLIPKVLERFGHLNCLVNNASVFLEDKLMTNVREIWDQHFEVNLRAPFVLSQQYIKHCNAGSIINMLDQSVTGVAQDFLSYNLSRQALWALTQSLALSYAPQFRVNAIAPGPVLPNYKQSQDEFKGVCVHLPLQKNISPQEIAEAILFLVERQPSITGHLLLIDGGQHLQA